MRIFGVFFRVLEMIIIHDIKTSPRVQKKHISITDKKQIFS